MKNLGSYKSRSRRRSDKHRRRDRYRAIQKGKEQHFTDFDTSTEPQPDIDKPLPQSKPKPKKNQTKHNSKSRKAAMLASAAILATLASGCSDSDLTAPLTASHSVSEAPNPLLTPFATQYDGVELLSEGPVTDLDRPEAAVMTYLSHRDVFETVGTERRPTPRTHVDVSLDWLPVPNAVGYEIMTATGHVVAQTSETQLDYTHVTHQQWSYVLSLRVRAFASNGVQSNSVTFDQSNFPIPDPYSRPR